MTYTPHEVRVTLARGGRPHTLRRLERFQLTLDMLELADSFSLDVPFTRELWALAQPDTEVRIHIDDSPVFAGYIDDTERTLSKHGEGSALRLRGRDRGGRLVDESAPLVSFAGIGVRELAERLVLDWFDEVSLSNATNRALIRGRRKRHARVSREPAIFQGRDVQKRVEPGESRAQVLQSVLEEAGLLAWSSADGKQFIVGKPNYDQEPQWHFFAAGPESARAREHNVLDVLYRKTVGERYSAILACGSSRGDGVRYGRNVTKRKAITRNGPNSDGTGADFAHTKRLIVSDDNVKTVAQAQERSEREMALRDATGEELELGVSGFGQSWRGRGEPVIFATDTIAHWEDEEAGVRGAWLLTRIVFEETRRGGQTSQLSFVPRGTELRVA